MLWVCVVFLLFVSAQLYVSVDWHFSLNLEKFSIISLNIFLLRFFSLLFVISVIHMLDSLICSIIYWSCINFLNLFFSVFFRSYNFYQLDFKCAEQPFCLPSSICYYTISKFCISNITLLSRISIFLFYNIYFSAEILHLFSIISFTSLNIAIIADLKSLPSNSNHWIILKNISTFYCLLLLWTMGHTFLLFSNMQ